MLRSATTACAAFAVGFVIGGYFLRPSVPSVGRSVREKRSYDFINPLLACEFADSKDVKLDSMQSRVRAYAAQAKQEGLVTDTAFYTRIGGGWTGVGENETFVPASLYKVPILITYLKLAETSPALLDEKVVFSNPVEASAQDIRPGKTLVDGQSYAISELLRRMIVYSDNDAQFFLLNHIDAHYFDDVFSDLGFAPPQPTVAENAITSKQYAFFLRVLYNASYLSRPFSEAALKLLSEAEFKDGIEAGLPQGIPVAHKFGEYKNGSVIELHDCGIVYDKPRTYTLCVMTRGKKVEDLEEAIKNVSKIVYEGQKDL